jgi:threonyl-tRNA synthetase
MEGEAAFYGPKIDVHVEDAIGRLWQLTTVQFDFNLPDRFGLEYVGADNAPHCPFMIHRALFGSVERFFGVLLEHYAGAFPIWPLSRSCHKAEGGPPRGRARPSQGRGSIARACAPRIACR